MVHYAVEQDDGSCYRGAGRKDGPRCAAGHEVREYPDGGCHDDSCQKNEGRTKGQQRIAVIG
jgi:hypothetical protein